MVCKFAGKFGMYEMELAAVRIADKPQGTPVSLNDMATDDERCGFVEFAYGGWFKKTGPCGHCYNGSFIPIQKFWDRIAGVQ